MRKNTGIEGKDGFPNLAALMGGYFHQDFDIEGNNTLEKIIGAFKGETPPELVLAVRSDVQRFLDERRENVQVDEDMQKYFQPDVLPVGWDSQITNWRQWLTRVYELLVETPNAINR